MTSLNEIWKKKLKRGFSFKITIPWPEGPSRDKKMEEDMGILKNIGNFFTGLFNKFIPIFKAFIAEALPIAKAILIALLKDIAINAVTKAQNTDLNDDDKRKQAFKEIKAYAIDKGIKAGDSIINITIELALQKIKG